MSAADDRFRIGMPIGKLADSGARQKVNNEKVFTHDLELDVSRYAQTGMCTFCILLRLQMLYPPTLVFGL